MTVIYSSSVNDFLVLSFKHLNTLRCTNHKTESFSNYMSLHICILNSRFKFNSVKKDTRYHYIIVIIFGISLFLCMTCFVII